MRTHRLVAGVLAGSLLFGGAGAAFAAKGTKAQIRTGFAAGQVSNLSATGFTLTWTPKATAQNAAPAPKSLLVTVSATTKERALKGTTGALANGEYALVVGPRAKGAITAARVIYSVTPFKVGRFLGLRHRVAGTIQASTGTSLTILTRANKTLTFAILPTTRFRVNGQLATVAPAFTTNERVVVLYTRDQTTKALVARAIVVPAAKA